MPKIITVIGARPQFIKAAPLSRAIIAGGHFEELLLHTGQHYDHQMSQVFFDELKLPHPHFRIESGSASHGRQTATILAATEEILLRERPAAVIVYGDTNSTLAGALAAAKLNIPLCHVESGMRSFNKHMPEEINRVLTDHASDLLFCPTETARTNLLKEGFAAGRIFQVGDIMYDASLLFAAHSAKTSSAVERLALAPKSFILASIHRAENTDSPDRLSAILEGLGRSAATMPVVLPLHPRTAAILAGKPELQKLAAGAKIVEPLGFLDMLALERNAKLVVTDSGGVQKEAYFYKVPCLTLRDQTEWVELLDVGWNTLLPPRSGNEIFSAIERLLAAPLPAAAPNLYGNGDTANRILEVLKKHFR